MNIFATVLIGLLCLAGLFYVGCCLLLYFGQHRLMYYPDRTLAGTPADLGLPYEDLSIPVGQAGDRLHGWWIPHPNPDAPVLLFLHGNTGNISCYAKRITLFRDLGFTVALADYRSYGLSDGPFPREARLYEDAQAILKHLRRVREIPASRLLIYGHSLGGAIAINLMQNQAEAAGLVVEGSFTSMSDMSARIKRFRWFPVRKLVHQYFDSLRKVPDLKVPVLYVHGQLDRTVPAAMSTELYEASPNPKELLLLPTTGHLDTCDTGGEPYQQALRQFMAVVLNHCLTFESAV